MELIKAILLGIVQGLTEFLPVSSSGHLVIGSQLLGFKGQGVVFDVFLHLGTLLAVIAVFRRDLVAMIVAPFLWFGGSREGEAHRYFMFDVYIIVATLPAVFAGLFFMDAIERAFSSAVTVYGMLMVSGTLMLTARFLPPRYLQLNWPRSLLIGCAQACAIMPGLSRSGATIFAGMAAGIPREKSAAFSFLLSIPAILGAAVLQLGDLAVNPPGGESALVIGAGTIGAAISGYLAIRLLFGIIRDNRLHWFGIYCLAVAAIGLGYYFGGGA